MKERRKYVRIKTNYKVDYSRLSENGKVIDEGEAQTEDVSKSGACLKLDKFINEGTVLNLKIYNKLHEKPIDCSARIVWMKKERDNYFICGLDFTRIGWIESDKLFKNPD